MYIHNTTTIDKRTLFDQVLVSIGDGSSSARDYEAGLGGGEMITHDGRLQLSLPDIQRVAFGSTVLFHNDP